MSVIYATDDLITENWAVQFVDLASDHADLLIGFTAQAPIVLFDNLRFGYELRQGVNIKAYGVFPPADVRYVMTDQQNIVAERLNFSPDTSYTLWLWCQNGGQRFEKSFDFVSPKPAQPYQSWVWDGGSWAAPTDRPSDGGTYAWDEESLQWVIATPSP